MRFSNPRTFKYCNYWHKKEGYWDITSKFLFAPEHGSELYRLLSAQKIVKQGLKCWKSSLDNIHKKVIDLREKCGILQLKLKENHSPQLAETYYKCKEKLHNDLHLLNLDLKQKAKINWLTMGDDATKFFYATTSARRHNFFSNSLISESGNELKTDRQFCSEAVLYFKQLYNQNTYNVNFPDIITKKIVSEFGKIFLNDSISIEEVAQVFMDSNNDKSPGSDGCSAKFYKLHWSEIKYLVHKSISSIFDCGRIIREINHTNIPLVPKKIPANNMNDIIPISCCNFIYKVLAKVLCN